MRRPTAFSLDEVRYEPEELYPVEKLAPDADAAPAVAKPRTTRQSTARAGSPSWC